jgi:phage shock protein C
MKICPYCAEPIQESAVKCRYCGSHLQASPMTREWYRLRRGKRIAGVCAGLAAEFGISTTPIRLAFILLSLIGGPGVILYIILWLIMPYGDAPLRQRDPRSETIDLDETTTQYLDRG